MSTRTPSSAIAGVVMLSVLAGCAGYPTSSGGAASAVSESPRESSESSSSAVVGNSFTTVSGSGSDVDLAWLRSEPFTAEFSSLSGEPTIGFKGPCQGTTFTYSVDDAGAGRILESRGMTYQACTGAARQHGDWFFVFINRPGVTLKVSAGVLVMTSGSESVTAVIE